MCLVFIYTCIYTSLRWSPHVSSIKAYIHREIFANSRSLNSYQQTSITSVLWFTYSPTHTFPQRSYYKKRNCHALLDQIYTSCACYRFISSNQSHHHLEFYIFIYFTFKFASCFEFLPSLVIFFRQGYKISNHTHVRWDCNAGDCKAGAFLEKHNWAN